MSSSAFVLMYASLARAPEHAMSLASRMAATAFAHSDFAGVQRWMERYYELHLICGDDLADSAVPGMH